ELRDADKHSVFVKIGALLAQANFHSCLSSDIIAIPVRDRILRRTTGRLISVDAAEILRLPGEADVFLATGDEQGGRSEKTNGEEAIKCRTHKNFSDEPLPAAHASQAMQKMTNHRRAPFYVEPMRLELCFV